jgi:hypothetical protein
MERWADSCGGEETDALRVKAKSMARWQILAQIIYMLVFVEVRV